MKNPRIHFTLGESDAEIIEIISKQKKMSTSSLIRRVVEDWLEEYEDMLLARRAEEVEQKWIAGGCKSISSEEMWKRLDT